MLTDWENQAMLDSSLMTVISGLQDISLMEIVKSGF